MLVTFVEGKSTSRHPFPQTYTMRSQESRQPPPPLSRRASVNSHSTHTRRIDAVSQHSKSSPSDQTFEFKRRNTIDFGQLNHSIDDGSEDDESERDDAFEDIDLDKGKVGDNHVGNCGLSARGHCRAIGPQKKQKYNKQGLIMQLLNVNDHNDNQPRVCGSNGSGCDEEISSGSSEAEDSISITTARSNRSSNSINTLMNFMQDSFGEGFWRDRAQAWKEDPLVKPVEAVLQTEEDKREEKIRRRRISNASTAGDSLFLQRRRGRNRSIWSGIALLVITALSIFAIITDFEVHTLLSRFKGHNEQRRAEEHHKAVAIQSYEALIESSRKLPDYNLEDALKSINMFYDTFAFVVYNPST